MRKDGLDEIYELISSLNKKSVPLKDAEGEIRKLYKKNGYDRGITLYNSLDKSYRLWGKINMSWPNATTFGPRYEVPHPKTGQPVKIPDRGWRWKQETFDEASLRKNGNYTLVEELHDGSFRCGKIWFAPDEKQQPSSITYLDEVNDFLLRSILSFKSDGGIEVENIFEGKNYFSYPKPTTLIRALIASTPPESNDIVLDFFSGSATTAHAVMQLNAEDGGNRQFIMVQLPESCDEKSEAFKAGYKTIAEIGKERIRRAGKKILEDECNQGWNKDVGFRVLKVDSSCMEDVYYTPDQLAQQHLSLFADNIRADRRERPEDLLYQVLIDWGVELHLPIKPENIQGKKVFFVDENALAACFESGITEAFIQELAKRTPLRAVFRDAGFASDDAHINAEQIFRQLSPHTEVKVI